MIQPFLEFCKEIEGYTFYNKKSGKQVYRYQMYWGGLTASECFKKYNTIVIIKERCNYGIE